MRLESTSQTFSATTSDDAQTGAVGDAERRLVLRSRVPPPAGAHTSSGESTQRQLARLVDEREMPCHLRPVERHLEEETQRRHRRR